VTISLSGQSVPPCAASISISLVLIPSPHDALHSPQSLILQLTGTIHAGRLPQDSVTISLSGQSVPPCAASISISLVLIPSPHDALHSPQSLILQLTGTGHFLDISQLLASGLGHCWPPWLAGVVTILVLIPGPQSPKFTAMHSDHSDTTHLTAAGALSVLKNGMTTVATVLTKLEMPSPITAVVKRLLAGAGRSTLALIPAPPKGVVKSTLPPNSSLP